MLEFERMMKFFDAVIGRVMIPFMAIITIVFFLASQALGQQVTMQWDANSESDLAGYRVYKADTAGGPYDELTSGPQSETTYQDTTIEFGVQRFYVVTAVNTSGLESGFSNEIEATIPNPTPPAPPSNLQKTSQGANLRLNWDPVPDADSYLVEYAKSGQASRSDLVEAARWRTKLKKRQSILAHVRTVKGLQASEPSEAIFFKRN